MRVPTVLENTLKNGQRERVACNSRTGTLRMISTVRDFIREETDHLKHVEHGKAVTPKTAVV